ncbi:MAG: hypothetical protein AVDCRST_MAG67-1126 [uncultured Solirubrobacteraceae bacterium]|uniref:Uncharacterized protein n=1 Tax=uncultured Solirubrobacteraceae bacterium TaxID=1162706 RepID=A0A6J4S177_9ACTN|nr:MAG: hypothetical protein AVDCRST_MAG67-1126 [uncultured Solirubrobacteraceae bacterium]
MSRARLPRRACFAAPFALKRRFAAVTAERLRRRLEDLADSLGRRDGGSAAADPAPTPDELEFTGPADSKYIRRMATFRAVDALALWGFLAAGRYARCPRGQTLEEEGAPAAAL